MAFGDAKCLGVHVVNAGSAQSLLDGDDVGHTVEEEAVDTRQVVDFRRRPTATKRAADMNDAVACRAFEQGRIAFLGLRGARVPVDAKPRAAIL